MPRKNDPASELRKIPVLIGGFLLVLLAIWGGTSGFFAGLIEPAIQNQLDRSIESAKPKPKPSDSQR